MVLIKDLAYALRRDKKVADILHLPVSTDDDHGGRISTFHILDELESDASKRYINWDDFIYTFNHRITQLK